MAIRVAQPGGLGTVNEQDVGNLPPTDLVAAMTFAAERDLIARQYTNAFADILDFVAPTLARYAEAESMPNAIAHTHLATMAKYPDSLIRRKCGHEIAAEATERARRLLDVPLATMTEQASELWKFDTWLRADGHRRNPGTTADMLAAALFVHLREKFK